MNPAARAPPPTRSLRGPRPPPPTGWATRSQFAADGRTGRPARAGQVAHDPHGGAQVLGQPRRCGDRVLYGRYPQRARSRHCTLCSRCSRTAGVDDDLLRQLDAHRHRVVRRELGSDPHGHGVVRGSCRAPALGIDTRPQGADLRLAISWSWRCQWFSHPHRDARYSQPVDEGNPSRRATRWGAACGVSGRDDGADRRSDSPWRCRVGLPWWPLVVVDRGNIRVIGVGVVQRMGVDDLGVAVAMVVTRSGAATPRAP